MLRRPRPRGSRRLPHKVMFYDGFDSPLSHLIFSATEIFLQPSMFEPCGLTQLAAMRYGAVPVVRAVGGLDDTVVDEGERSRGGEATGFKFKELVEPTQMVDEAAASDEFLKAMERAINLKIANQDRWNQLIANGMNRDSSWTIPAMQYARLYDAALANNLQRWCEPASQF